MGRAVSIRISPLFFAGFDCPLFALKAICRCPRARCCLRKTTGIRRMLAETDSPRAGERPRGSNRRKFLGQAGAAATFAAGALASPSVSSAQAIGRSSNGPGGTAPLADVNNRRVMEAFELRVAEAMEHASVPAATNLSNGDEARYADKGGTYTKGLPHDSFGRVNLNAYQTFKTALNSGEFSDFEAIILGGTRTLNGPQGGLAFCLDALDNAQFGRPQVPPAPAAASDQNATEFPEHYCSAWPSRRRSSPAPTRSSNDRRIFRLTNRT